MKDFRGYLAEAAKELDSHALRIGDGMVYLYVADSGLGQALESFDMSGMERKILFVFTLKDGPRGTETIGAINAQRGYGPIAYKVAMEVSGGLTPTQETSQMTRGAENIWVGFYSGRGSRDVKIDTWGDDEPWKQSTYRLKRPLNYRRNVMADKAFVGRDPYGEKRTLLDELADQVLSTSMRGIY
jgi:hypothetical protein